jgi:hypothetical protein
MRNIKKKIMLLVCVILIIIGLIVFNFFISFSYGNFQGFLAEHRSPPKDEELELTRNDAVKHLTQTHTELATFKGHTLYEKSFPTMCSKGTHGWKRTDPYAYVCSNRLTYYYGTNREYKELLLDLEKTLNDLGWKIENQTPKQPTISESIREYSGEIYLVKFPYYNKSGNTLAIDGFYGYGGYWIKSSEEHSPFGFGIALYQAIYKNKSNKSPAEIFNRITSSGQNAIMIVISTEYFRN